MRHGRARLGPHDCSRRVGAGVSGRVGGATDRVHFLPPGPGCSLQIQSRTRCVSDASQSRVPNCVRAVGSREKTTASFWCFIERLGTAETRSGRAATASFNAQDWGGGGGGREQRKPDQAYSKSIKQRARRAVNGRAGGRASGLVGELVAGRCPGGRASGRAGGQTSLQTGRRASGRHEYGHSHAAGGDEGGRKRATATGSKSDDEAIRGGARGSDESFVESRPMEVGQRGSCHLGRRGAWRAGRSGAGREACGHC